MSSPIGHRCSFRVNTQLSARGTIHLLPAECDPGGVYRYDKVALDITPQPEEVRPINSQDAHTTQFAISLDASTTRCIHLDSPTTRCSIGSLYVPFSPDGHAFHSLRQPTIQIVNTTLQSPRQPLPIDKPLTPQQKQTCQNT